MMAWRIVMIQAVRDLRIVCEWVGGDADADEVRSHLSHLKPLLM
jgi:hypothetical protein